MGDKVYKPILKEGDHLDHSRENPERLRGVSRDQNNKNPDIVEWEEYDVDDLQFASSPSEINDRGLSQEQKELVDLIVDAVITGAVVVITAKVAPWCKNTAWPWIKEKGSQIKEAVFHKSSSKNQLESHSAQEINAENYEIMKNNAELSEKVDQVFDQLFFEMNEEDAQKHLMRLIYHMLGVVNEIRILSNANIKDKCESKEEYIEKQKETELLLSKEVATRLNQLLNNDTLELDMETSRELFALTGGGVQLNGEYVPVQTEKINKAFEEITSAEHEQMLKAPKEMAEYKTDK